MRLKHILNRLQVGQRLKIVYERITLTGFTKTFILIALAHCLAQIALQSIAFSFNRHASDRVSQLIAESQIPPQYAFVSSGKLYVCSGIPPSGDPFDTVCWAFAGQGIAIQNTTQMNGDSDEVGDKEDIHRHARFLDESRLSLNSRGLTAVPTFGGGAVTGVNVTGLDSEDPEEVIQLSARCIKALNWPSIVLHDAQREDISFLVYQMWLLGISLMTLLNESIPHLVAALVTHGLSTAWSAFQLSRTGRHEDQYLTLVVDDSCGGVDVIPGFWANRMNYFIPILVLNAVVLLISFGVSLKLFNVYARQTFKRVGASKKLNLQYSVRGFVAVMTLLSAFFTICGSALWIDSLSNGVLRGSTGYRVVFTIASVVELPWVVMGWISIRREHHIWSLVFLIIGLALCGAWTSMFANMLYRWSFQNFPFFAAMTITAFIVLVGTVVLAIVCRLNFGKGLPHYLKTKEVFDDSSFIPVIVPRQRQSRLMSVVFPDRRTSALRKPGADEKPPVYRVSPRERRYERPSSDSSVLDIKAPSLNKSVADLDITGAPSAAADDGHSSRRASVLTRARSPFFRLSDNSRFGMGKMSLRFSAFTSSSTSADLERGVSEVPVPLPKLPPPSLKSQTGRSAALKPLERTSGISRSLSTSSRTADLPAINIIPASVKRSDILAEQGDFSVRAASEASSFASSSWIDSYGRRSTGAPSHVHSGSSRSINQDIRGSPPRYAVVGLPRDPRAYGT